jgi:O-antigen/teichoic acid export membrane protein
VTLKDKAVSSVFWTSLQQFGGQLITFIVSIVLARILEPKDFGIIALFGILTGVATVLMTSGMTISIIRSNDIDDDDLSTVFIFNMLAAFVLYAIIFVTAPLVEKFYDIENLSVIIRAYSVIFVIQAFGAVQKTLLIKALNFKKIFIIQLPSLIISSAAGICMAYMGFGVWTLVYMGIINYFLDAMQIWIKSDYMPKLIFNKDKFRKHFSFGINMTLYNVINIIFQNLYNIYIGKVFSSTILGFYNKAESLKNLPTTNIMNILNRVLVSFFSKVNDDELLKNYYKKITSSVIFLLSPILVIMIFQAENIVIILLTEKWIQVVPYLQILCFSAFLMPFSEYNINLLVVKGKSNLVLKLEIYKKIIIVTVFAISLIWGIYGLLIGQIISSIIVYFFNSFYTKRIINYSNWEQIKDIFPYIIIGFITALIPYFLLKTIIQTDSIAFQLIFFVAIYIVTYFFMNIILKLKGYVNLLNLYKTRR